MTMRTLPNSDRGRLTETVGLFNCDMDTLATWLSSGLGDKPWPIVTLPDAPIHEHLQHLKIGGPPPIKNRLLCALDESDPWTALFTDGPGGTDTGMLPSWAARELDVQALRTTTVDHDSETFYKGSVLEIFDPSSEDALKYVRAISAVNDGGRWVFAEWGEPLPFEDTSSYRLPRKRDRLTPEMLRQYVIALGVPPVTIDTVTPACIVRTP